MPNYDRITGGIIFDDLGPRLPDKDDPRHIISVFGTIGVPASQVKLFVPHVRSLSMVTGNAAMLGLNLTGESIPLPEELWNQSYDRIACGKVWRVP